MQGNRPVAVCLREWNLINCYSFDHYKKIPIYLLKLLSLLEAKVGIKDILDEI